MDVYVQPLVSGVTRKEPICLGDASKLGVSSWRPPKGDIVAEGMALARKSHED